MGIDSRRISWSYTKFECADFFGAKEQFFIVDKETELFYFFEINRRF